MTLFYNEELRLLLEICILLLKANRREISAKELDAISETHFKANNVSGRLALLDKTLGLKESLAVPIVSIKEGGPQIDSIQLKYSLWHYEKMLEEITKNKFVSSMRETIWMPFYKEAEAKKEVVENSSTYKGWKIRGKTIFGIGEKSICLIDETGKKDFHWFILPKNMVFKENAHPDGFELAKEIILEHQFLFDERHLCYIVYERDVINETDKINIEVEMAMEKD